MTDYDLEQCDRRTMRRLFYVLLFAILAIWTGLLNYNKHAQSAGSLVCLACFVWIACGGWRVMHRCLLRHRGEL